MSFELSVFLDALTSRQYIYGAYLAVTLAALVVISSVVFGLLLALCRRSTSPALRAGSAVYIWIFRAIPVLLVLLVAWNALPQVIPALQSEWYSPFIAAYIGLVVTETAISTEILHSGLSAVDEGQILAAKVLGLTPFQTLRKVTLPQVMRVAIPPLGNQFIIMIKLTSLASVISLQELLASAQSDMSRTFRFAEYYGAAALYYLVIVSVFMVLQAKLENAFVWTSGKDKPRKFSNPVRSIV